MIAEFSRLLGYDTQKKFCDGLQNYTPVILRLPPLKEEPTCIEEIRIKAVSSTKTESERECKYSTVQYSYNMHDVYEIIFL